MALQEKLLAAIAGAVLIAGSMQVPGNDAAPIVFVAGVLFVLPAALELLWRGLCLLKPAAALFAEHAMERPSDGAAPGDSASRGQNPAS